VKVFDYAQRSAEWFAARRGIPTASRFDNIVTPARCDPSTSQAKLINALLAESLCPPEEEIAQYVSPDMEFGMKLEAEARCAYEFEHANKQPIKEVGFILADCGMFGGSPDALVGEEGGVEIKVPAPTTHIGYIRAGVLPQDYKVQIHGHLIVTGRKWWDFWSYARHLPSFRVRVERDDFTKKLETELHAFCARYNEARQKFGLPPLGATAQP
jgi:hypothetical protein